MKTCWTSGGVNAADITKAFKSGILLRKRLVDICNNKAESSQDVSTTGYESPGWAYRQADSVGYQRAMKEIISILS